MKKNNFEKRLLKRLFLANKISRIQNLRAAFIVFHQGCSPPPPPTGGGGLRATLMGPNTWYVAQKNCNKSISIII